MRQTLCKAIELAIVLLLVVGTSTTTLGEEFYGGKRVRIIVGFGPGGGPDIRARLVGRHLAKYLPGKPSVIIQNMPGAGGVIAGNFLFNVAKPDGLTLANLNRDIAFVQLGGREGVQFDMGKFQWIGSLMREGNIVFIRSNTPYRSIEDLRKAKSPLVFAARSVGATNYIAGKALQLLGVPVKLVVGYGTAKLNIAFAQGEIEGSALGWAALKTGRPDWVNPGGLARLIVELGAKPTPGIQVAFGPNLRPKPGAEEIYKLINQALGLPQGNLALPPATPEARVKELREAYRQMLQDHKFQSDAAKLNVQVESLIGEELAQSFQDFLAASPSTRAQFTELLH